MSTPCLAAVLHQGHACARRDGRPILTVDDGDCHLGAALDLWLADATETGADRVLAGWVVALPDLITAAARAVKAVDSYLLALDDYLTGLPAGALITARAELDGAHLELALATSVPLAAQKAQAHR